MVNNNLIGLYSTHLRVLWMSKFLPAVVIGAVGTRIIFELLVVKEQIPITWLYYLLLGFLSVGIFGATLSMLMSFLKEYTETKWKMKDASRGDSE